jgi:putative DNA primase/helicase
MENSTNFSKKIKENFDIPQAGVQAPAGVLYFLADDKIPQKLKDLPSWVCWRKVKVNGRLTKVPFQPESPGKKASSTNPRTWRSFEQAVAAAKKGGFDGIGYVFSPEDPLAGIDIDHCRDPITGELKYCAQVLVYHFSSYCEESPSREGIHSLIEAKWPENAGHKKTMPCGMEVEVYDRARYFTVTGWHLTTTPTVIEDRQAELDTLHALVFTNPQNPSLTPASDSDGAGATVVIHDADLLPPEDERPAGPLTDEQLIEKAHQGTKGAIFGRLWSGDITAHDGPDRTHNGADLALCSRLAFWCGPGPDPERIDRLFRRSGLCQDPERIKKWNRQDYRDRTISKALKNRTEFYDPARAKAKAKAGKIPAGADLTSLQDVAELLKIPIESIFRISGEPVKTVFKIRGGGQASFNTRELLQQGTFRARILDASNQLPHKIHKDCWEETVLAIVQVAERVDVGADGTLAGMVQGALFSYLQLNPPTTELERFDGDEPVSRGGEVYLPLQKLKNFLRDRCGTHMDQRELAQALRMLGATPRSKGISNQVYRLWEIPKKLIPTNILARLQGGSD